MDEDDKVISLAERLGRKTRPPEQPGAQPPGARTPENAEAPGEPLPGKLTWLHCPACGTVQYTEVFMTSGRRHNVCGNPVEEAVVDVDVRAEFTIAAINLERLKAIESAVTAQRAHYEEYQRRLRAIAGAEPRPYPLTHETVQRLPVAEVDALGLLVPEALHDPARRFAPVAPAPDAQPAPPGSADEPDPSASKDEPTPSAATSAPTPPDDPAPPKS